jgi:hypothetical protein
MRPTPTHIGRALADRLRRGHVPGAAVAAPAPQGSPADLRGRSVPRATRLRRLLGAARITPYQLRRGWLW